jgi:hypothetical protein
MELAPGSGSRSITTPRKLRSAVQPGAGLDPRTLPTPIQHAGLGRVQAERMRPGHQGNWHPTPPSEIADHIKVPQFPIINRRDQW